MKIYTRAGDGGKTRIHGGQQVDKDDIRIEANGSLDELNSVIGIVRSFLPEEHEWQVVLFRIQSELMVVMSLVATPSATRDKNPNKMDESLTPYCEQLIDDLSKEAGESTCFILPGGTQASSFMHLARTVARRSERHLCTLHKVDELPQPLLSFVNRLSDLFFIMARCEMFRAGTAEERWKDFLYKKRLPK